MAELARVPVRPAWEHDVAAWVAEDMLAFPDATGYVNALFLNDREHANRVDDVIRALGDAKRSIGLTGYIHRTQWSSPPYDVIVVFGHPFTSAGKQLRAALTNNALRPGGIVFAIYCVSHDHEAVACHRPCTFEADEGWLDPVPVRDFESENDRDVCAAPLVRHRAHALAPGALPLRTGANEVCVTVFWLYCVILLSDN